MCETALISNLIPESTPVNFKLGSDHAHFAMSRVLVFSIAAIIMALVMMFQGNFIGDPSQFALFPSNGIIFISYFFGTAAMLFIVTKL